MGLYSFPYQDTGANGSPLARFTDGISVEQFVQPQMPWPEMNLPVSDYHAASFMFQNPTDEGHYLNSLSDLQESILPFSLHFEEPYIFPNLPKNGRVQSRRRSVHKTKKPQNGIASRNFNQRSRSVSYHMHDADNRNPQFAQAMSRNIESPNFREVVIRPSKMLRTTKSRSFQMRNRLHPSYHNGLEVQNHGGRSPRLPPGQHLKQQYSRARSLIGTNPNQSYKPSLKIPDTIRVLSFPERIQRDISKESNIDIRNLREKTKSPTNSEESKTVGRDHVNDSRPQGYRTVFGERKRKLGNETRLLTITHPTYQNEQEDNLEESGTSRITAREGRIDDENEESFMPSQYVIDLKFRKSDNLDGRSPESMRSKGFTETHHRLVERFEEIHQHGETGRESGHRSNKEHYKNEGYHGSSDGSSKSYGDHDGERSGKYSASENHHYGRDGAESERHHSTKFAKHLKNNSDRRETLISAPSEAHEHHDQSVSDPSPVAFGKPPIKVPTLLNGRGSSRGAPYTIAYRGPHEADVHPPIPSRDFRVNEKFRQWATSHVSVDGGLR